MTADAYPLDWPDGWPRTRRPERSRFDTTFATARDALIDELRLLGARHVVLSTNIPLRNDGLPYARYRTPEDRGVAVYFLLDGRHQCIPCDKWDRIEDNVQAIRKTVEALRGLERWGAKTMVDAAFRGFRALPDPGSAGGRSWREVLGVSADATWPDVQAAYRRRRREAHPDSRDGNSAAFQAVQKAWQQAREEFGA